MKTFKDILKQIEATSSAIRESEENEKRLLEELTKSYDYVSRHALKKELEDEWIKAEETTRDLYLTIRLLQNNARIALFHEVMPVLLEVLAKYKGKPYGEKTREKIALEVKERAGASAYVGTRYDQDEISIYPTKDYGNTYSITVRTNYDTEAKKFKRVLLDNKIQVLPLECFSLWYVKSEYFEDIPTAVAEMKEHYKRAVEMKKELATICSAFNRYAVDGVESIDCNQRIHEKLLVK